MKKSFFLLLIVSLTFSCQIDNDLALNETISFPKNEKIYFLDSDGKTVLDSLKIDFKFSNDKFSNDKLLRSSNKNILILPIENLYH